MESETCYERELKVAAARREEEGKQPITVTVTITVAAARAYANQLNFGQHSAMAYASRAALKAAGIRE